MNLVRLGWQAEQIKREPADKRVTVRFGRWLDFLLLQPGEDEGVNRVSSFGFRASDLRNRRPLRRIECPVVGLFYCGDRGLGPVRARVNPRPQLSNLLARERLSSFTTRRHLRLAIELRDEMDEFALRA